MREAEIRRRSLSELNGMIQQYQTPRRSFRRRVHDRRTRKWAERSVWSEVCARDLGLIVSPLTPTNVEKSKTREKKYSTTAGRPVRGISKKSITEKPRGRISSTRASMRRTGPTRVKDCTKNPKCYEHPFDLQSSTRFFHENGNIRGSSDEEDSSKMRKKIICSSFNIFHDVNADLVNEDVNRKIEIVSGARESKKSSNRQQPFSSLASPSNVVELARNKRKKKRKKKHLDDKTRDKKLQRGTMKILRKRRDESRAAGRINERISLVSRNDKSADCFVEKSNRTDETRVNSVETRLKRESAAIEKTRLKIEAGGAGKSMTKNLDKLREAISMSKITKISAKNISKNDYEDSEIDESLLVDPSTDLPQSLAGTIDDNVQLLANTEFDVSKDFNFESDEPLSSNLGSFEQDIIFPKDDDIPEKSRKSTSSDNSCEKLAKKFRNRSNDRKITSDKPRGSQNELNKMASLFELRENGVVKMVRDERRVSSNGAAVVRRRRRRSIAPIGRENGGKNEDSNEDEGSTRVTRLSMRNFIAREIVAATHPVGTIVWGNCMGWWPGFIVNPEDVGMRAKHEKVWICWIGEYRISNLREKTQIQEFSMNLEERMIVTLRTKNSRDMLYRACLETIELISEHIIKKNLPSTVPRHVWARKNLTEMKNIDRLILQPYPSRIKPRLDELREKNARAMKKYFSELNSKEKLTTATTTTGQRIANLSKTKNSIVPLTGDLSLEDQKPGVITWAKIAGQVWWPACIVDYRDWGMKEPNFGCQWIVWYGDSTMSQIDHRCFMKFETGIFHMKDYTISSKREIYRRGVIDAAKDYCSLRGFRTDDWHIDDAFAWFEPKDSSIMKKMLNILPGIPGNSVINQRYPSRILEALRKHRTNFRCVAASREDALRDSEDLKNVKNRKSKIDDLCLVCLRQDSCDGKKNLHPFFVGRLCDECTEIYLPTIFAYGDDGKCFFCSVCAGSDLVVICDEENCPRVYCTACIKYLVTSNFYDSLILRDPWSCFVCDENGNFTSDGLLRKRDDWQARIEELFRGVRDSLPDHNERWDYRKTKIRVLSLFDGISAGLVVLKKLGMKIDAYYASEIDENAEMISSAHHGTEIIRLGDVRALTSEKIREILPINLLIGGSPCNDLSLVNPSRLGLHDPRGTGILVFQYARIKELLETENAKLRDDSSAGKCFFWLFENVASMPSKYRREISNLLGREPELIDSANYSPQHRPRLYWSNLPAVSFPLASQDLQDFLIPNCNRRALVKKIRTVTTRINSLRQTSAELKPILMNDRNDTLWITELEEIFGFPRHYTDVKNLSASKRQKLIGMSWSVQTIVEIMRPLCNFFYTRNDETI